MKEKRSGNGKIPWSTKHKGIHHHTTPETSLIYVCFIGSTEALSVCPQQSRRAVVHAPVASTIGAWSCSIQMNVLSSARRCLCWPGVLLRAFLTRNNLREIRAIATM